MHAMKYIPACVYKLMRPIVVIRTNALITINANITTCVPLCALKCITTSRFACTYICMRLPMDVLNRGHTCKCAYNYN